MSAQDASHNDNGNGRVTLALLMQEVRNLTILQERTNDLLARTVEKTERRFHAIEVRQAEQAKDISSLDEDMERLQSRDLKGTVAGIVAAVIAGILALINQK